MNRNINLLEYLPVVVSINDEFQKIADAENPEFNLLLNNYNSVFDNQFIDSLNSKGCERWENILHIAVSPDDTIADRRFRILSYLQADIPYTFTQFKNIMYALCDQLVTITLTDFNIRILVNVSAIAQVNEIDKLARRILPANITYQILLKYNSYWMIAAFSNLELNSYTFKQLREDDFEVVEPTSHNILGRLLHSYLENFSHYSIRHLSEEDNS